MRNVFLILIAVFSSLFAFSQNIKTKTEIRKDENGNITLKKINHFFENGDKKRIDYIEKDEITAYRVFTKKEDLQVIERKFDKNDKILEIVLLKFDENDEIIYSEFQYGENGPKYFERYIINYDENENIIKLLRLLGEEQKYWEYFYEFDNDNNKIKSTSSFEGKMKEEIVYEYKNNFKNKQSIYSYKDGHKQLLETIVFKYKKGNLVEKSHSYFNKQASLTEMYKYYKNANIKSVIYKKNNKIDYKKEFYYTFFQ